MDIIQESLSAALITAQTDEELHKIEASVGAVVKLLASSPTDYLSALYTVVGRSNGPQSPLLESVFTLVKKDWRTVGARYPGFPTEFLRAILLCAIVQLASEDEPFADALGMILPAVEPLLDAGEAEVAVWTNLVDQFQARFERKAEDRWSVPSAVQLPALNLPAEATRAFSVKTGSADAASMAKLILPALTNNDIDSGEPIENGNPFAINQLPNWSRHAAKALGSLFAAPYASALKPTAEGPDLEAFAEGVAEYAEDVARQMIQAVAGQDLRTRLLWWKESAYSPSARKGYAGMSELERALRSAIDLAAWLPEATPPSAFYFVRSTTSGEEADAADISEWVKSAKDIDFSGSYGSRTGTWNGAMLVEVLDASSPLKMEDSVFSSEICFTPRRMLEHLLREILGSRIVAGVKPGRKVKV